MKFTIKPVLTACLAVLCSGLQVNAQELKMPASSTGQTIMQDFGLGKITLTYSRPNVKGRKIFGSMEPYDKVWRTGANGATVISFSEEVKMDGNIVPAGEYALFTIPGKNEWTIILNKTAKQWGAYEYKEADDLVRFKVKPINRNDKTETFTMQFTDVMPTSAQLHLIWDKTAVAINLTTEVDEKVMASIDEAMKGEKKPYFQAAQYYYENGKDMQKALEWMNAAEAADQKAPWIKLWKARIQMKTGDKKGAAATAGEGVKLATEMKNDEYIRLNSAVLAEAKK